MLNQEKMPGAGSVADTVDFMKRMWGGMGAPSMMTPSLSVEDINQKISDLKTVASWLELNLNMLKATIQTLEVQSATLSTLQAMSAILASREPAEPDAPADGAGRDTTATTAAFPFGFPMWPGATAPAAAQDQDASPAPTQAAPQAQAEPEDEPADPPPAAANPTPDFQAAIANPNAWWNVLQEQFKHAVGNAMAGAKAEQEPLLKPVKPAKSGAKVAKPAKRSVNKTVAPRAKAVAPKAGQARASGALSRAKPAPKQPGAGKTPKSPANTSASARTAVVQSRQNKKPAPRKPTSP